MTAPSGTVTTKLPRTGRVPTRGQSTDGPIVMGSTQYDDGMEHAWSPTRSAAGRRLRPCWGRRRRRVAGRFEPGGRSGLLDASEGRPAGSSKIKPGHANLRIPSYWEVSKDDMDMSARRLARRVGHETRWAHSLPFGVERTADRLLPPGARLADGPGCPPDRGRPMSGLRQSCDRRRSPGHGHAVAHARSPAGDGR